MGMERLKESTMNNGRIAVYVPNHPQANNRGYVLRARYVMEQFLGRYLTSDEEVHHIDFNKINDDISNLKVMTKEEHARLHNNLKNYSRHKVLDYDWLKQLRKEGYGYKKIAKITGYPVSSIKSAVRSFERIST